MAILPSTTAAAAQAPAASAAATPADRAKFGRDFDSFLKLLTSQLKHQDPLSPMDSTQFTQQLVQFTGVEQQIKQNESLEALLALQQNTQIAAAASYLGRTVEAGGQSLVLAKGEARLGYSLDAPAREVRITIRGADGTILRQLAGPASGGAQSVTWDGRSDAGTRLPDGSYRFAIAATDSRGQTVPVRTGLTGTVDGFDVAENGRRIVLRAGTARIPIGDVTAVR